MGKTKYPELKIKNPISINGDRIAAPFGINAEHQLSKSIQIDSISSNQNYETYKHISEKSSAEVAKVWSNGKFYFDPIVWKYFYKVVYKQKSSEKRLLRQMIQMQTIYAFLKTKYVYAPPLIASSSEELEEKLANEEQELCWDHPIEDKSEFRVINLPKKKVVESVSSTVPFLGSELPPLPQPSSQSEPCKIIVVNGDCLDAALLLKAHGLNAAMLVMASRVHPGGGYRNANAGQEEDLCRRTNLFLCLEDPYLYDRQRMFHYPLPELGGMYVPHCITLRKGMEDGYEFLTKPEEISMIAMNAISHPPTETDESTGEIRMDNKNTKFMAQKIDILLHCAVSKGHDAMVLSAWGSGVYSLPAKQMAELFKTAIEKKYKNYFKCIVFAILDDANAFQNPNNPQGTGNLVQYKHTFKKYLEEYKDVETVQDLEDIFPPLETEEDEEDTKSDPIQDKQSETATSNAEQEDNEEEEDTGIKFY